MSISRRLEEAREAWQRGDREAAARVHDPAYISRAAEEHGGAGSQYIGNLVYGGLDGIITTFAVVSGVAGASLGANIVLIMGLANLLGDGFSMAAGAYLSAKSEIEYYNREREREAWEVEHFPEGERAELIQVYLAKGYSEEDAARLVEIQTKTRERWVDAMMINELSLIPAETSPIGSAIATLAAFVVAGAIPLLVYLVSLVSPMDPALRFPIAVGMTAVALFALGAAKVYVTERNWLASGLEMLLVGGLASGVAYLVGYLLRGVGV